MVVYRVNTAVQGNYRSDTDGIYVFRPDETTLNAGGGDLTRSCYGGKNAPDSIGSTDLESTFADGAWSIPTAPTAASLSMTFS